MATRYHKTKTEDLIYFSKSCDPLAVLQGSEPLPICQVDALKDKAQFRGTNPIYRSFHLRQSEYPALQSFIPAAIAIAVPIEDFNLVAAFITKDKQMTGKDILF
jgi:hypothetical protein